MRRFVADDLFHIIVGVNRSVRCKTKKPQLNHDENR